AGARRVAGLDHEVLDDAVELDAVVEVRAGEEREVVDGLRRALRVEPDDDLALARRHRRHVRLARIDGHRGRRGIALALGAVGRARARAGHRPGGPAPAPAPSAPLASP